MATVTERIPVLVSVKEKHQIAKMAKEAGLSMGEYLRRAASSFRASGDDQVLEGMIEQMLKSTVQASAAIDDALTFVAASNRRIAKLEAQGKEA